MKTIRELYSEVMSDDSLQREYMAAEESGREVEFMKAHGCEATAQELEEFMKNAGGVSGDSAGGRSGELSDDELDDVAAGKKCGTVYSDGKPVCSKYNSCRRWRCNKCGVPANGNHDFNIIHWPTDTITHCESCKYFSYTIHFGTCSHPARKNN